MGLEPRIGVTGAGCRIWIELVRGVGAYVGGACGLVLGWVMDGLTRAPMRLLREFVQI